MSCERSDDPSSGIAPTVTDSNSLQCSAVSKIKALEHENRQLRRRVAELAQERNLYGQLAARNW